MNDITKPTATEIEDLYREIDREIDLAYDIMEVMDGRAGIRINGEIVESNPKRTTLFVGDDAIPRHSLLKNLTEHELYDLENLPEWDGSNDYQISRIVLRCIKAAIRRYNYANHKPIERGNCRETDEYISRRVKPCYCSECFQERQDAGDNYYDYYDY